MNALAQPLPADILAYCAKIGADPLLTQGAGGNVSWKENDTTLWVKASGTWLADAGKKALFVPVDLGKLKAAFNTGNFSVTPQLLSSVTKLKPSIETLLHALMPHRIVIHLHAIEILAHLVRAERLAVYQTLLNTLESCAEVDYCKPGPTLAAKINAVLLQKPATTIFMLKNHGVVIGGADIAEIDHHLQNLINILKNPVLVFDDSVIPLASDPLIVNAGHYQLLPDNEVQQLAFDARLFNRLATDWALYPDQVVFLGPSAYTFQNIAEFVATSLARQELPELIFIFQQGVYVHPSFSKAKQGQLRCYYDVLVRQQPDIALASLTQLQIAELLNWDAEHYRMNVQTKQ